jgi:selenide,water dikinase
MVPGCIAGDYARDDVTIDLVRLCRAANVRFVAERATGVDAATRTVTFSARPELKYDVLSFGVGSVPARPPGFPEAESSWAVRPLGRLLDRLDTLARGLQQSPRPFHFAIVGGGASGCELALAVRKRFAKVPDFRVTLLQANARLLPEFPDKTARIFTRLFEQQGIDVRTGARVTGGDEKTLELDGTDHLACDAVLWATNAAAPPLIRGSGLPATGDGFLKVHDTLQSVADPAVFGTGDCISLESRPDMLKNGVLAVREGRVLLDNVTRFLREKPLRPFRPQRICLCLMNTADGDAAFNYGPLVWKSRLARRLKDRIDRAWIAKHTPVVPAAPAADAEPDYAMRCGGCGNKISSDVLSAALKRIDVGDDPRLLLGVGAGEDAAVHRVRPELFGTQPEKLVEVQTVDYFKAFVDDPFLFGRIAAINAVSDLYAMNARPFSALAIATLPYARGPILEATLFELLSGAVQSLREAGAVLSGGHTTEGSELALGFAVTGYADEDRLFQKSQLQPGDLLILTKPLGSGALLAAWMRGACRADWFDKLIRTMLLSNRRAGEILGRIGVRACTDVTGFGLAGHLLEMLDASRAAARLDLGKVPVYDGFADVVSRGIVSTLHRDNAKSACRVATSAEPPAWLFDPQTSGGLLAGVKAEAADEMLRALADAGYEHATVIGEVTAIAGKEPPMILLSEGGP